MILKSASEAIGNTPLVALDRITGKHSGRIFAKLEMLNPGFSKKDRAARQIIEDAETDGSLQPGQTVVELTFSLQRKASLPAFRPVQTWWPLCNCWTGRSKAATSRS